MSEEIQSVTRPMVPAKALIAQALADQRLFTPVGEFSRKQSKIEEPGRESVYRDLIPLSQPAPGEQYAFVVNLDACSGCKACVSACHSLNGLDDDETWRDVGLLFGENTNGPVLQTITSACHHCLEPACLTGCPVEAYDKDPITGIVRHLDDQCIGCQYCIFKCPYDVPKYSPARGIVRKCDMCHQRLAVGEAPACVQACPTQAIQITTVNRAEIEDQSDGRLLPGTMESHYTKPTTRYIKGTALPLDLETPHERSLKPEHAHLPLVAMLSLTQWSVGCFVVLLMELLTRGWSQSAFEAVTIVALLTCLGGLGASFLHLGRPLHAWKAFLGFRTSWLSREIIVFSGYAAANLVWIGWLLLPQSRSAALPSALPLLAATTAVGVAAVFCSIMVYVDTRRSFWGWLHTGPKFCGTMLVLGIATAFVVYDHDRLAAGFFCLVAATKLLIEARFLFRQTRTPGWSSDKRSALVMLLSCGRANRWRFVFGVVGGIVLPLFALVYTVPRELRLAALCLCLMGELLERFLFFAAVTPGRMPGIVLGS